MDDRFLTQVEQLAAAGRAQELEFDGVVARVTADHFCALARPAQADVDRFVAVMLEAMPRIDEGSALRIAEKISTMAVVPEIVLARLAERSSAAAATIFRSAPSLSTALMLRRAERGDCAEAIAIASRPDLDQAVVAALARRTEPEALRALASNAAARIDPGALVGLVQRARFDGPLARALLRRPDLGLRALSLFLWADTETRRSLVGAAQRAELESTGPSRSPLLATRQKAISAAHAGNRAAFATAIALALRTGRASIDRMIDDESGEPLALLFAAMGASASVSADAMAMLRPGLFSPLPPGVALSLETSAAAAARIVVATTSGRSGQAAQEYASPRAPAAFDPGVRAIPDRQATSKLNRA